MKRFERIDGSTGRHMHIWADERKDGPSDRDAWTHQEILRFSTGWSNPLLA